MENSSPVSYIKSSTSHHFKISFSQISDLKSGQFVSTPEFHALGQEWVIDCYSVLGCWNSKTITFVVICKGKCVVVRPRISCSIMKRGWNTSTQTTLTSHVPMIHKGFLVIRHSEISHRGILENFVHNGSFELVCCIDKLDIITGMVPESFNLKTQIGKLLESKETADVTFDVENRSFTCHRAILAARSPVFKAELFGNMVEATQKHIKIKEMSPDVFEAMLRFVYTDYYPYTKSDKASTIMAQHLFVAADRYSIEGLKVLCEDQLFSSISLDTIATILALSVQHNSLHLKNACIEFIAKAEPKALISWMLTDEYAHLLRSVPSVMSEIRTKFNN